MSRARAPRRTAVAAAAAIALVFVVAVPASAAVVVLEDESFRGISTPADEWIFGGSHPPCLTAGTGATPVTSLPSCGLGDADGSGVLRLTDDFSQTSYAILNTPIDTSLGLQISFDMFQYDGDGDGMVFMLVDGSVTPSAPGYSGAALGYASYGPNPGITGGYVAVAFDVYGAFANAGVGTGDAGMVPNGITIRGSEATGYQFISAQVASSNLAVATTDRTLARHPVLVTISSENIMSVAIDYGSGYVTEVSGVDLDDINGAGSLPATLKLGFSAGTGGAELTQEIQDFQLLTLAPNLGVTFVPGEVDRSTLLGSYGIAVSSDPAGGSTSDVVTVTSTLPAGVTPLSATGTGWSCGIVAQFVTCTRPGTGADRLDAGEEYPVITVQVSAASAAVLPASLLVTVATADDSSAPNNSATVDLALAAAGLAVTNGIADPWVLGLALALVGTGVAFMVRRRAVVSRQQQALS